MLTLQFLCPLPVEVNPEMREKKDPYLLLGVTIPCIVWMLMNVVDVYSVYYDTPIIPLLITVLQVLMYLLLISAVARWVMLVRRKNDGRFQTNLLNVNEYTFLLYIVPALLYPTALLVWVLTIGANPWQELQELSLIFYASIGSVYAVVIIGENI